MSAILHNFASMGIERPYLNYVQNHGLAHGVEVFFQIFAVRTLLLCCCLLASCIFFEEHTMTCLVAITMTHETIDFYFRSQMNFHIGAISRLCGSVCSIATRLYLVFSNIAIHSDRILQSYMLEHTVASSLLFFFLLREREKGLKFSLTKNIKKTLLPLYQIGFPSMVTGILMFIINNLGALLAKATGELSSVGIIFASTRLVDLALPILGMFAGLRYPHNSLEFNKNRDTYMGIQLHEIAMLTRVGLLLIPGICLGSYLATKLIYGAAYDGVVLYSTILSLAILPNANSGLRANHMILIKRTDVQMYTVSISLVATFLCWLGLRFLGPISIIFSILMGRILFAWGIPLLFTSTRPYLSLQLRALFVAFGLNQRNRKSHPATAQGSRDEKTTPSTYLD
jgi:O-antigen/teichoic acid export membrane protein